MPLLLVISGALDFGPIARLVRCTRDAVESKRKTIRLQWTLNALRADRGVVIKMAKCTKKGVAG